MLNSKIMRADLLSSLRPLKHTLYTTICAWRLFQKGSIKYFQDNIIQAKVARRIEDTLRVIEDVYTRLQAKLEVLEKLMGELDDDNYVSVSIIKQRA